MKKVVIVVLMFFGIAALAQRGQKGDRNHMKDLTPEQMATLQTKKATLALDLTQAQQTQMKALFLVNAKERKTKMAERKAQRESGDTKELTSEEKYARANSRLDKQIAQKEALKNILSEEQFEKWQKMKYRKGKHRRGQSKNGKSRQKKERK